MPNLIFLLYLSLIIVFLNPYSLFYISSGLQNVGTKISLISFYPFAFLPFFLERTEERKMVYHQLLIGCGLFIFSSLYFSFSFFWIGSLFICLSFLPVFFYRFHTIGFFIFLLAPPFVEKYTLLIGFELRILLSKLSNFILYFIDVNSSVEGNLITFKNQIFSVDPACEGLKFFTGILLLLLSFSNMYLRKNINLRKITITLFITLFSLFLWIWSNLVRIILLILFAIPEESIFHSLIGIICFLCFIGIPFSLIWSYFIREENETFYILNILNPKFHYSQIGLFLLPLVLSIFIIIRSTQVTIPQFQWVDKYGDFILDKEILSQESQFYRNKKATMILKRNLPIIGLGHHPKICFEAIGYRFNKEEETSVSKNHSIRRAEITKQSKTFFLSWWYVPESITINPKNRTASEWKWRMDFLLNNQSYLQVNLITNSKEEAEEIYKELAKQSL